MQNCDATEIATTEDDQRFKIKIHKIARNPKMDSNDCCGKPYDLCKHLEMLTFDA